MLIISHLRSETMSSLLLKSKPKEIFTCWIELNYTFVLTINYIFKYLIIYIFVKLVNITPMLHDFILKMHSYIYIYPYVMLYILISYWAFICLVIFDSISWFSVMINMSSWHPSCLSFSVFSFFIQVIKQRLLFIIFLNNLFLFVNLPI